MNKRIKLKESDLTKIVKRIINEQATKGGDKPTQDCSGGDKNCTDASCNLQFSIVADGTYPDGTDRVRMEYIICGTGVLTLTRNYPQPGSLVFSVDTCDTSFNTAGGMHLPIVTNTQQTNYVPMVVFEVVLDCDNGQTVTKKICFSPQTMSVISCKKPLPTSPPLSIKHIKESDLTNLIKRIMIEKVVAGDCPEENQCSDDDDCGSFEDGHYECVSNCCTNMTGGTDPDKVKPTGGKSFLKKKNYWKKPTRKILKIKKH